MNGAGGDLKVIKVAVHGIIARLMSSSNRHEDSVLTAYADDDRAVWKDFRRELLGDGFFELRHSKAQRSYQSLHRGAWYVNPQTQVPTGRTRVNRIQHIHLASIVSSRGSSTLPFSPSHHHDPHPSDLPPPTHVFDRPSPPEQCGAAHFIQFGSVEEKTFPLLVIASQLSCSHTSSLIQSISNPIQSNPTQSHTSNPTPSHPITKPTHLVHNPIILPCVFVCLFVWGC